ncbi:MAG TPA: hypothetical protein VFZ34_00250 [Blastocatellia bacterium]|nr:hypothetical protein [Blastocatellia bacterium]
MRRDLARRAIKVELTMENDDGSVTNKTLIGANATQWQRWVDDVCLLAWTHRPGLEQPALDRPQNRAGGGNE